MHIRLGGARIIVVSRLSAGVESGVERPCVCGTWSSQPSLVVDVAYVQQAIHHLSMINTNVVLLLVRLAADSHITMVGDIVVAKGFGTMVGEPFGLNTDGRLAPLASYYVQLPSHYCSSVAASRRHHPFYPPRLLLNRTRGVTWTWTESIITGASKTLSRAHCLVT